MRRELSSSMTVVWKFVFPVVCFSILGPATLLVFITDHKDKWGILPVWVAVIALYYWGVWRFKTVVLEKRSLYISDLRHTIKVPVSEIAAVGELFWFRDHPIRIEFKHATRFGKSIMFIPYFHFRVLPYYSHHPVATQLRKLAGLPREEYN